MKNEKSLKSIITIFSLSLMMFGCGATESLNAPKSSGPNGSYVCGCGGSCTSTAGDGIPDTWKTIGVDSKCSGVVDLDLSAYGADPRHKDIFVRVDTMAPRPDHSAVFTLTDAAMKALVDSFSNAPVLNPDGTTGIHLHLIHGLEVPYSKVVTLYSEHSYPSCAGNDFQFLGNLKTQFMPAAQAMVFHYALIADMNSCDTVENCYACNTSTNTPEFNSTGTSVLHSKNFVVSLGSLWNLGAYSGNLETSVTYTQTLAGTLMHELGHNFGLRHGGGLEDTPNYKPNYLSVMNYRYQMNGIPTVSGGHRIDYSREALPDLNEALLDETSGLGSSDPTLRFTFVDATCTPRIANASGPVDWNGNGIIDSTPVSSDLNPAEDPSRNCGDVMNEQMHGHEDWSVLDYGFYSQQVLPDSNSSW